MPVLSFPTRPHARTAPAPAVGTGLGAARQVIEQIGRCTQWAQLLDTSLQALRDQLGIEHSAILWAARADGAMRRVAHLGQEPQAPMALPLLSLGCVRGTLLVEADANRHPALADEDTLASIAVPLALSLSMLAPAQPAPAQAPPEPACTQPLIEVRHHAATGSTFVNGQYLIRGVAGAILWKMVREAASSGRHAFCNRELRLDPSLGLPDVVDNLETRLLLLRKRLQEHQAPLQIDKVGRGRVALRWQGQLQLIEA
jgi:hypothetical protein